ncbi:AzlC family ABC transporter permease [Meiothermus hypogaeus]|uniref:Branched-chain amino acid transporter AzlC n=2 Tax=Meiothermus hypogaeus TaxID=884155 RepID=A0A511R2X7_9DEIN|nr:AzlC family ABC transporter permease [Meiothermus hypogaeus]RIH80619.1 Inner membrane protein YgaZ [Meiothermus hypogaeus]GEM83346.1 branched-chain amino acid transporter AzlC [Meiothermus hypogaeus NBRC 106114]GIW36327.1 MAG: branched-chain amino acid transporter AzlC [Meiothermus sp.]
MAVNALPPTPQAAFWRGVLVSLPIAVGIVPFGLVTGIAGVKVGLSAVEVTVMSVLVFAGAAQLVALQLMGAGASIFFVWLATLVVNLRYIMYSSALARPLETLSGRMKILAAFLMVDQNFALALNQYGVLGPRLTPWFYLGIGVLLWLNWVVATYLGALLGARLPEAWALDFAVPLCFLVLLVPAVHDRPSLAAALVGGLVSTALIGLPYRSGLFIGALVGIGAGVWLENRMGAGRE